MTRPADVVVKHIEKSTTGAKKGCALGSTQLYSCGRSLVRKRPSAGVSITPMELGWTRRIESLPMHWLGGSDGQNKEGSFPMVGIGRETKRETIGYLAK
jgi:hypothetical protein